MKATFLIRDRQLKGSALQNAARYDAAYLNSQKIQASVLALGEGDTLQPHTSEAIGDVVVIEGAGWVTPEVIRMMTRAGKRVIVRVHAAPEFLYFERPGTSAIKYIREARELNAEIAYVSDRLAHLLGGAYLPINYPVGSPSLDLQTDVHTINVGCFGSIRPLKNHVGQLIALGGARGHIKQRNVRFHINSTRIEGTGFILAELEHLAQELEIPLVKHDWHDTDYFRTSVIPQMQLGLFGSFAESFCITAADFVAAGVPSVLSSHIPWASGCDTDTEALTSAIVGVLEDPGWTAEKNLKDLRKYSATAAKSWQCALEKGVYAAY